MTCRFEGCRLSALARREETLAGGHSWLTTSTGRGVEVDKWAVVGSLQIVEAGWWSCLSGLEVSGL